MRIRKNRKITALLFPEVEKPQPHICLLNRAPWDVIYDWDEPIRNPSSPLHELFVVGDDNNNLTAGNGISLGDSIEGRESVSSMEKPQVIAFDDNYDTQPVLTKSVDSEVELIGLETEDKTTGLGDGCNNGVPKPGPKPVPGPVVSWRGRRIAKGPIAWGGPRSGPVIWRGGRRSGDRSMVWRGGRGIAWRGGRGGARGGALGGRGGALGGRGRGRFSMDESGKKVSSSSNSNRVKKDNPYEYYYYSGFGPLWGKRRGEKVKGGSYVGIEAGENNINHLGIDETETETETDVHVNNVVGDGLTNSNNNNNNSISSSSSSRYELRNSDVLIDYVDDDFDDDDDEEENGDSEEKIAKKRMRKPVKARSLKSLM